MATLLVCPFCDAVVGPAIPSLMAAGYSMMDAQRLAERRVVAHLTGHVEEMIESGTQSAGDAEE